MKNNTEKYQQAKEHVEKIKGFYTHLAIYLLVNTIITALIIYHNGFENIHLNMFSTWFFWGIGIFFHGMGIFGKNFIFSKDWEKRKIQELIEEENQRF